MPEKGTRTKDKKARKGLRRWMFCLTAATLLSATLWQSGMPLPENKAEAAAPQKHGRVVMYAMDDSKLTLRDEDAEKLDQLNYSFALIKNGKADGSHWNGIRQVRAFLKKHPHIDGVLAVGGWGADGFSDACATESGRKKLADSILALMDENGFVGVDIDWEYPGSSAAGIKSRAEDVENWYALLALLREGLDARTAETGRKHLLSVALGAGDGHLKSISPKRLDALVDQAVVMAYDLCGFDRQTGHHAVLSPDEDKANTGAHAVKTLVDGGLSADKVLLGVPAYGRVWRQVTGGGDGLGQRAGTSGNKTISFDEVRKLESQGYIHHYDLEAEAAWWFDGSTFVSAEDERSLTRKCAWARSKGLQGIAVWSYGQDASGALLGILHDGLTD